MELALVVLILCLATLFHGTLGFGTGLVAMPMLTLVIGVQEATALVAFVIVSSTILLLRRNWRSLEPRATVQLIVSSVLGVPIGIFLLTKKELHWFYQDGASMIFPDAWERFLAPIPEAERGDLMGAYYKRLIGDNVQGRERCALAWAGWEGETVSVEGPNAKPDKFAEPDFAVAFARI